MPPDPPHQTPLRHRSQNAWDFNARIGLVLFFVYLALYGGFIYLSAFRRDVMARPSVGGVNLAVVYGFGLIVAAFVLAVLYMFLCRPEPPEDGPTPGVSGAGDAETGDAGTEGRR